MCRLQVIAEWDRNNNCRPFYKILQDICWTPNAAHLQNQNIPLGQCKKNNIISSLEGHSACFCMSSVLRRFSSNVNEAKDKRENYKKKWTFLLKTCKWQKSSSQIEKPVCGPAATLQSVDTARRSWVACSHRSGCSTVWVQKSLAQFLNQT